MEKKNQFYLNDWKNNNPNPCIDMTGKKINMLTVLYRSESLKGRTRWHCRCDCGKELDIYYTHLKNGQYSCGCATSKRISEKMKVHGMTDTRLFGIWMKMKERCYRKNNKSYKDYGGRGITICQEWLNFDNFADWAISNGYTDELTIDRIDVNGNYEPVNCRWATAKEQANNKRNTKYFEYKGEQKTLSQLADEYGIKYRLLRERIVDEGWKIERALTTPKMTPQQAVACAKVERDKTTGKFIKMEVE